MHGNILHCRNYKAVQTSVSHASLRHACTPVDKHSPPAHHPCFPFGPCRRGRALRTMSSVMFMTWPCDEDETMTESAAHHDDSAAPPRRHQKSEPGSTLLPTSSTKTIVGNDQRNSGTAKMRSKSSTLLGSITGTAGRRESAYSDHAWCYLHYHGAAVGPNTDNRLRLQTDLLCKV